MKIPASGEKQIAKGGLYMVRDAIKNKRILFICPVFYNYHNEIIKEMQKQGADVDFFSDKYEGSGLVFVLSYCFSFWRKYFEKKQLNFIIKNSASDYDFIFVIKGTVLNEVFMTEIKQKSPNAKCIMYHWDSLKNNDFRRLLPYFDKALTFDMVDAEKLKIEYLPLFFTNKYKNLQLKEKRQYDVVFFGSYHPERLEVLKRFAVEAEKSGITVKLFMYIPRLVFWKKLFTGEITSKDTKYLFVTPLPEKKILEFYSITKSVLDIENSGQNGFTMRTLEVLGSGLKLITTNKNILDDDIYNEDRIYKIDRMGMCLDFSFFEQEFNNKFSLEKYHLSSWIKNVFCIRCAS